MAHAGGFRGGITGMNRRFGPLTCFLSLAMFAALSSDAMALAARHKQNEHAKKADAAGKAAHHSTSKKDKHAHAEAARHKSEPAAKASPETAAAPLSGDLAAIKDAIDLVRKGKTA